MHRGLLDSFRWPVSGNGVFFGTLPKASFSAVRCEFYRKKAVSIGKTTVNNAAYSTIAEFLSSHKSGHESGYDLEPKAMSEKLRASARLESFSAIEIAVTQCQTLMTEQ
jgi:hypothetical protein